MFWPIFFKLLSKCNVLHFWSSKLKTMLLFCLFKTNCSTLKISGIISRLRNKACHYVNSKSSVFPISHLHPIFVIMVVIFSLMNSSLFRELWNLQQNFMREWRGLIVYLTFNHVGPLGFITRICEIMCYDIICEVWIFIWRHKALGLRWRFLCRTIFFKSTVLVKGCFEVSIQD